MVLPDSSAWVRYLRHGSRGEAAGMAELLRERQVATCGPVVAELMIGARAERGQELAGLLDAVQWIELGRQEWRRIGQVGRLLRERGAIVPLTDLEIAVAAEASEAALWSFDSDFQRVAAVMPRLRFFEAA